MSNPFETLKSEMDELVVGHTDVKTALLLGVVAREHIYIQGPPGTAKTMLSEIVSKSAELDFFFYQMHRDTRLSELVGDLVISREDTKDGEIIKQNILKGGILTSDICLLDDISRAPGESLNVLLRILNERKYGEEDIPLLTAIATSNPTADEYYNEPLDPANLDRFVIQVNSNGISYGKQWEDVKKVISLYATKNGANNFVAKVGKKTLDDSYKNLQSVVIPVEVQEGLVSFITWLVEDQRLNESNSVISDRTFLVKSLKLIKASAVIDNRNEANLSDLKVLKFLLPFRVPEEILEAAEQKLESLENQKKKDQEIANNQKKEGGEYEKDSPNKQAGDNQDKDSDISQEQLENAEDSFMQALEELQDNLTTEDNSKPIDSEKKIPTNPSNKSEDDGEGDINNAPLSEKIYATKSKRAGDTDASKVGTQENFELAQNVQIVMKVLEGNIQRSIAKRGLYPGGLPRRYKRMNSFYEIDDVDAMDAAIWSQNLSPQLPRVHQREKENMGGEIAILRDISTSMMGVYSEWSSSVVNAVVELARTKRMRVGYIEFNHKSYKTIVEEKFFTKDYETILHQATKTECSGNTNYEEALKDAISDFKGRGLRNKHILFITDGIPTSGDTEVRKERERAKKLGICIHSIFIGSKNFPMILNAISKETYGSQFVAYRANNGNIKIEKKENSIQFRKQVPIKNDADSENILNFI